MAAKQALVLVATAILAGPATAVVDEFNTENLPPGAIVRIVARRPAITLSRAEVVQCTSNLLTLANKTDRFEVSISNVIEMTILERPQGGVAAGGGNQAASDPLGRSSGKRSEAGSGPASASGKKSLWQRLLSLWSR